jgi:hypothetical protein
MLAVVAKSAKADFVLLVAAVSTAGLGTMKNKAKNKPACPS